jgi:hypothetical protein
MSRRVILTGAVLAVLLLAVGAGSASAATFATTDVGQNLGNWLAKLGGYILIPTAGLFGIAALFRRDVGHALTIALIAIVVGIFVYDQAGAQNIISSVAKTLTGQ